MKYPKINWLKRIVYGLVVLFILILLPLGVVSLPLSLAYIVLGIILIFLTLKSEVKGKLRVFLLLTGFSSAGLLLGLLHGFLEVWGLDTLQVVFFYIGVVVSPILFLIGAIGSIVLFKRKGGRHYSHS
jgi:hypothetical protein